MKKKVYCSECKHLHEGFIGYSCTSMNPYDNWYTNIFTIGYPDDRNRNNDCKWFERKE
jgi:hypothetical protein